MRNSVLTLFLTHDPGGRARKPDKPTAPSEAGNESFATLARASAGGAPGEFGEELLGNGFPGDVPDRAIERPRLPGSPAGEHRPHIAA